MTTGETAALEGRVREVLRAVRKLHGTEDRPIARRNARKRFLATLRAVKAQLNRDFPAPPVARKPRRVGLSARKLRTVGVVRAEMARRGWTDVPRYDAATYAARGIRVREVHHMLFVPTWVAAIGANNPAELRFAKKSVIARRAALAAAALLQT